jgi:membrane associated rhomboid family serine protease
MSYLREQQRRRLGFTEDGNAVMGLIVVNVIMFILLNFINIVYVLGDLAPAAFDKDVLRWFTLPGLFDTMMYRPWVLLTHMFTQYSIWQMIGNMFFLWAFGFLLQDLMGNRHIVPIYIYGALTGAFFFILSVNIIPRFANIAESFQFMGASAAVMAIAIAATFTAPDYRVFPMINGGIPLWVITLIYVIIDFAGLASSSFPHHLAHLAGAVAGFVYIRSARNGSDPGLWMHQLNDWFFNLFAPKPPTEAKTTSKQVFYNTKGRSPYQRKGNLTQQRVDEILDKISQTGVDSLTQEEKDILKRASENETLP